MSGLFGDPEPDALPAPPPAGPGLFGEEPPPPATPYRVLARKYRPTTFDDLIGQDVMVRILRRAFAIDRLAHAWMLTGVRGVGKTTTARIIARALNCIGPDGTGGPTADPCGICPNCVAILAERHPDVTEMDAASNTGVDDVRQVIEATRYRPLQARTKVFIIDEVHMLSRNAFNALLKTLEEPPPHVKFVFATTEIRKVPVTVLSRCQRFDLRRVSVAELSALFVRIAAKEGVAIEAASLDLIARAADGSVRDGLSLLDQAIAQGAETGDTIGAAQVEDMLGLADRGMVFDLMDAVMAGDTSTALAITARVHERGGDMGALLGDLLELVHMITRLRSVPELRQSRDLPENERVRGSAMADRLPMPVLGRAWNLLLRGTQEVEQAPDRRAAAEMVLIRLCYVSDLPPPGDLVRELTQAPGLAQPPGSTQPTVGRPQPASGLGPGARAVANGAPVMAADPVPRITSFRDMAQLVAAEREPLLHAQLLHAVHLVRFAPPVIELRPEPDAPRDLAQRLAGVLLRVTGTRWTIALSREPGEATLAEQGRAAHAERQAGAEEHPLVRAILDAFPGARIQTLEDSRADAYGLLPVLGVEHADMPEFAPIETMEDES